VPQARLRTYCETNGDIWNTATESDSKVTVSINYTEIVGASRTELNLQLVLRRQWEKIAFTKSGHRHLWL